MGFVTGSILGGCMQSQPWELEEVSKQCQLSATAHGPSRGSS